MTKHSVMCDQRVERAIDRLVAHFGWTRDEARRRLMLAVRVVSEEHDEILRISAYSSVSE